MRPNLTKIKEMVDQKYIRVQKHPTEELYIYNYTQKAQFDRVWNEETMMCRGLILDNEGNIIARPFDKFFNLGDNETVLPNSPTAYDKEDGSLGIMYRDSKGSYCVATRGSFVSEQAIEGTKLLRDSMAKNYTFTFNDEFTYLFEIIYPENRIVIDYGTERKLVWLGCRHKETGTIHLPFKQSMFEIPEKVNDFSKPRDNAEGVVVYGEYGEGMVKVKYEEYVRLHRLITGINARYVWELLKEGQPLDPILDRVPDEFFEWVITTRDNLQFEYDKWEMAAQSVYKRAIFLSSRKEQALYIKDFNCQSIVFAILDGKPYDQIIWKLLKPAHEVPFRKDES